MTQIKLISKSSFILFFIVIFVCNIKADQPTERKGLSYTYPQEYKEWENGFLAGNGKMGIIVFGNPLDETIIYNDRKFFMAPDKNNRTRTFNTVSKEDLKKIRDYCAEEKWKEANELAHKVTGWKNGGEGNKHPGFKLNINIPSDGEVKNYSRECDFRTGEIIVRWTDNRGDWERRSFVSRKDNVIVHYLKAPSNGKLNCSFDLSVDPGMHLDGTRFSSITDPDYMNIRVWYNENTGGAGYEGVFKVFTSGGKKGIQENRMNITDADYVVLVGRTDKYYSDCDSEWEKKKIREDLKSISSDYNTLLAGQKETHEAIFDRVKIDLGADAADRSLSNEELLRKQKDSPTAVHALWERLFDSGRYLYLSSSSDYAAPDLLGLWTGDMHVGWSGYYHLDANLNLQIGSGNIGAMPEAMEGYFTLMERLSEGFRINADKLLACRGMLGGGNTAGLDGLISDITSPYYPYQYVTGEMGWLLYPFWEHYLITGDKEFLKNRLYPLMREMGEFYEDFLVLKDQNGKYLFAGSISPEAQPPGIGYSLVNNSTFDIAGAKFCLETLLEICNMFGYEQAPGEGVERWSTILENLPPYLINERGALQEWSWPGFGEGYGHRHSSHLITVWPLNEISKEKTPDLYEAARIALSLKDQHSYEGAGHGLLHGAYNAANLNNAQSANAKLLHMMKNDFFFNGLASAHYADFRTFCTDVCNALPGIIIEMLVNSKNDVIELLPAIPDALITGSISGIKSRNRVTIENLEWNLDKQIITCCLLSDIDQDITLIQRRGIINISGNIEIVPSSIGQEARVVRLKAGQPAEITMTVDKIPVNLALGQPVKASSTADNCPPENAVDGNTGTRWSSAYTDNEWIYVDLGSKKKITEIILHWEAAYGTIYKIQTSHDTNTWTDLYTNTSGKGGIEKIPLYIDAERYIRILGQKRATGYGFSIWEIEIYGTDFPVNIESAELMENKIRVYPNPVGGILFIENLSWFSAKIWDMNGRILYSHANVKNTIDVSGLCPGIYILNLIKDRQNHMSKFIKL